MLPPYFFKRDVYAQLVEDMVLTSSAAICGGL